MIWFQSTLAFAPTQDDLDEGYFDIPLLTFADPEPLAPTGTDAVLADDREAANIGTQRQIA